MNTNKSALKKQELLCGIDVYPVLSYLENLYGYEKMCNIIEPLGIEALYLLEKKNWISYDYFTSLLKKLVSFTEDQLLPYKIYSECNSKKLIENLFNINSSINQFKDNKPGIHFIFNLLIRKKFSKIGEFKITNIKNKSIIINFNFKSNYKNNILYENSLKGFLLSVSIYCDLKKINISKLKSSEQECKYKITWKNSDVSSKTIDLNEIILSIEKIEDEHIKKNSIISYLEEKNKYLTILNNIRKIINSSFYFYPILFEINRTLIHEFNFFKGIYFQFNKKEKNFKFSFELINEEKKELSIKEINLNNLVIPYKNYEEIKKINYPISFDLLIRFFDFNYPDSYNESLTYFIPIELSDDFIGFYFFFSTSIIFPNIQLSDLFNSLIEQLKYGFQKISSRYIIENILTSIPSYVLIFNAENFNIKYLNNKFISLFPEVFNKYSKDEIIEKNLFNIIPFNEEVRSLIQNYINILSGKENIEKSETTIGHSIYEFNLFMIHQPEGSEKLMGIIINDITEAKYFQQNLINNQKLLSLGKIASGIAHEINNPLYAILANAEQINEDKGNTKYSKELSEEIIEHVMNISSIIKDLSSYSKTLRKEELEDIDLNAVINNSIKLIQYGNILNHIEIKTELSNLPAIKATKGEMQQVFINLFNNAIQSMKEKGILKIKSSFENKCIIISISDTGTGILEEHQSHIFELFFTTKLDKGTGQGLHIVKKILDRYNGVITFQTKPDKGTTFYIKFNI